MQQHKASQKSPKFIRGRFKYSIAIIIPTYNHYDDCLKLCLESIVKYTDLNDDIRVMVVANGCTDYTLEHYMEKLPKSIELWWSPEAVGFDKANNFGIQATKSDIVVLLNNDTVLTEQPKNQWLEMLMAPFSDPNVGITGPLMSSAVKLQRKFIIFFCTAIRRKLFDEIGLLDEIFSPGSGEDVDFCIKAENAGYKLVQVPDTETLTSDDVKNIMVGNFPIWHASEKTVRDTTLVPNWQQIFNRNTEILTQRYGTNPTIGKPVTPPVILSTPEDVSVMSFSEKVYSGQDVTATISTKNRYFTTLPLVLYGITQQEVLPKHLLIYDDGQQIDLREVPIYQNLFSMLARLGVSEGGVVRFGQRKGQVANHQNALDTADTDLIWRLDDDDIPESDVLFSLLKTMNDQNKIAPVAAVGSLIFDPKGGGQIPSLASNKIEDIFLGLNIQWFIHIDRTPKEVDHLYSTFLYRREAGQQVGGYCKELSSVGHREETIFTHSMKRAGWKLFVDTSVVTWHARESSGGIRDNTLASAWQHDEEVFQRKLRDWHVSPTKFKVMVLDGGLGDHYAFKHAYKKIRARYADHKLILAVCYPKVFSEFPEACIISIAEAATAFGDLNNYNIYGWMWKRNWKQSIVKAYEAMYL